MEEGVPFGSGYFKRPVGILMVVNSILSFICFVLNLYWLVNDSDTYRRWEHNFFMWITCYSTITLVIYIFSTCCDSRKVRCGQSLKSAHLWLAISLTIMWVCYLISSSALAYRGNKWNESDNLCEKSKCKIVLTSAAFGIIAFIGTLVNCILVVMDWKAS